MVQVPISQCTGIAIYLLAITGIGLSGTKLSWVVAEQAVILALPHLDNSPPKLSLMERRSIDAALAVPLRPSEVRNRVAALEAPPTTAKFLAARLDLVEKEDLVEPASPTHIASAADGSLRPNSQPSSIAVRVYSYEMRRTARSNSRHAAASAGEVFNRSFGVISVAAD